LPPKKKFTKEQITQAAYEIADEFGFDGITIRKIAAKLNSSVAPIYVSFENLDELKATLAQKIMDAIMDLIASDPTEDPFLDIGAANIRYALDHPLLYKDYMLNPNCRGYFSDITKDLQPYLTRMRHSPKLEGISDEDMGSIFMKMKVFTSGVVFELLTDKKFADYDTIISLLRDVGDDIMDAYRMRNNK